MPFTKIHKLITLPFCLFLLGCTSGNLGEDCNKDGTCNSKNLICRSETNLETVDYRPVIVQRERCRLASEPATRTTVSLFPQTTTISNGSRTMGNPNAPESEKFCSHCASTCINGFSECKYVDTTVWGNNNPSVCRCK